MLGHAGISPYLPLIVKQSEKTVFNYDSDTSGRVRRDVNTVLTNLYNERPTWLDLAHRNARE